MGVTRFGLQIPNFTYPGVDDRDLFAAIAEIAGAADESGFDSVWVMDHFYQISMVGPRSDPMLEAYTLLGAIAARTRKVSLGTMVTGVTYRNPALLAKQVTTLDIVSAGRAILGIGAAWNDEEHAGYGFGYPPIAERLDRLEEALQICRAMFTQESPSFAGIHYTIDQALNFPRPIASQWRSSTSSLWRIVARSPNRLQASAYFATSARVRRSPLPPTRIGIPSGRSGPGTFSACEVR